jgi:hypothetical protein
MPETNGTLKFAGILGQFGSTSNTGSGVAGFAADLAFAMLPNEQNPALEITAAA